jgi:hypothetical protein
MTNTDQVIAALHEKAKKRLGIQTLETRNRDSLDFHDVSVDAIREIIKTAFEAGQVNPAKKTSSKRFSLMHVYGSVDPNIIGKPHKTYESLLKAAKKFVASDDYTDGEDGIFYIVSQNGRQPRAGSFDSSELEN